MRYLSLILILTLFAGKVSADNYNFKWIKEIRYEQIRPYSDGLSAFKQNDKWGFIDVNGKVVISPVYDDCQDFSNGVAAVKMNGQWGYIDASGKVLIRPAFEECTPFVRNVATARKNGKWGVINKGGQSVAGFIFDKIGEFNDGFAYANNGTIPYYVRSNGKAQKLSKDYTYGTFSDGMAPVMDKKSKRWGFINAKGQIAIETRYDTVYNFSNGIALVKRKGEYQYIGTNGGKKNIDVPTWQELKFVNGVAKVKKTRGVGFMNSDFKMLPVTAKDATDFNESGIAVLVMFDNSIQYINKEGRVVAKGDYDRVGNFSNGLAWVSKNDKFGYIDMSGKMVIDTIFTSATDFGEGVAFVQNNGRLGSIRYQKAAVMPELQIKGVTLNDNNSNNRVEAEERFMMSVTVSNPADEDLEDVSVQFASLTDQEEWFEFDDHMINIPKLKAHRDTVINFRGTSNVALVSDDISVKFRGTASNMFTSTEHDWSFEALGINACKPIITKYWVYTDSHRPIRQGDRVNLRMTIKNDGKDLAKNVKVDLQWPEGIYAPAQNLTIASMKPGEVQDINATFTVDTLSHSDLTIVAMISDYTQLHNKVEYLSFAANRMNAEVSLEGGAAMRFQYGGDNMAYGGGYNMPAAPQLITSGQDMSQEITANASHVSELLEGIEPTAKPDKFKYAIVIGNEDYNSKKSTMSDEPNVDFARYDAEVFAEYAKNYMGVPEKNVFLMKDATSYEMRRQLDRITSICKENPDTYELILFYAGHGQHDDKSKETYLMPVDISLQTPTYGLKLDDVYAQLGSCGAKKTMVFMDACYSGIGRGIILNVKEAPVKGNVVVFTATSSSQRSMPYKEKKHGMFTYYLLKTIKDNAGKLTVKDLYEQTRSEVTRESIMVNDSKQSPELISGEGIENGWENWVID